MLLGLHEGHERRIHAAELGPSLVDRYRADAQFTEEIGDRQAGLCPFERIDDLAVSPPDTRGVAPLRKLL